MATNPRSPIRDRSNLSLVRNYRTKKSKSSRTLATAAISTAAALVVLVAVLWYLPPGSRNTEIQAGPIAIEGLRDDLQLGSLQMSWAPLGETIFLDGVAKNAGLDNITGATVEVRFHDFQGKVISSVQKPIGGIAHGTGFNQNEFAGNPIQPNEIRFFRVAIERAPPGWNQEVPELKIVMVKAQ